MWLAHAFFISVSSVGEACAVRLRGFRLLFTKTLRWRSTVILHMEKNAIAAAYESGNAAAIQAALIEKREENRKRGLLSWGGLYLNISNCYIAYENTEAFNRLLADGYTLVKGVRENMIVPDTYCDGTGWVCLCQVYYVLGFRSGRAFSRYMRENALLYKGKIEPLACADSYRWY